MMIDALIWPVSLSTLFYVCASSEGSGEAAHKRRCVWSLGIHIFNKYQNLMSWPIVEQNMHFLQTAFAQSCQSYCNVRTQTMNKIVCMH